MFIRQGDIPVVLFCVWFGLNSAFPWLISPVSCPYSYISLRLGCAFCYKVGPSPSAWVFFCGFFSLEDQDEPGVGTRRCNVSPARGCSLAREGAVAASTYWRHYTRAKLFSKFPILFFQEVSREWDWARCRF